MVHFSVELGSSSGSLLCDCFHQMRWVGSLGAFAVEKLKMPSKIHRFWDILGWKHVKSPKPDRRTLPELKTPPSSIKCFAKLKTKVGGKFQRFCGRCCGSPFRLTHLQPWVFNLDTTSLLLTYMKHYKTNCRFQNLYKWFPPNHLVPGFVSAVSALGGAKLWLRALLLLRGAPLARIQPHERLRNGGVVASAAADAWQMAMCLGPLESLKTWIKATAFRSFRKKKYPTDSNSSFFLQKKALNTLNICEYIISVKNLNITWFWHSYWFNIVLVPFWKPAFQAPETSLGQRRGLGSLGGSCEASQSEFFSPPDMASWS